MTQAQIEAAAKALSRISGATDIDVDYINYLSDAKAALTAAEVGDLKFSEQDALRLIDERNRIRAATTERCAQVAHSFRERFFNHPMEMADAIAAAIRALKDKP